jgi:DNA-binding MarR family transcriptional regulator
MDVTRVILASGGCPVERDETLGCRLQHLARVQRTMLRRALEEAGLHPGQEQVLSQLWAVGPQTQAELAAALEIDTSTVSKTLARLERAGFISRARSGDDRRAVTVTTTPQGDALRGQILGIIANVDDRITRCLTPDERTLMLDLLRRLAVSATD